MKKMSKVLGAMGLSAALAVGTAMPAFALPMKAPGTNSTDNVNLYGQVDDGATAVVDNDAEATGETTAYIGAVTYQIDAEIPLAIAMVGDMAGGSLMTPKEGIYTITNNNDTAGLVLTNIETTVDAGAALSSTTTQVNWLPANTTAFGAVTEDPNTSAVTIADKATSPTVTAANVKAKYGFINAQLTPVFFTTAAKDNTVSTYLADNAARTAVTVAPAPAAQWIVGQSAALHALTKSTDVEITIPRKGNDSVKDTSNVALTNELGLKLDVNSSKIANYNEETGFVKAFTIKYTVKAPQTVADAKAGKDFYADWTMNNKPATN